MRNPNHNRTNSISTTKAGKLRVATFVLGLALLASLSPPGRSAKVQAVDQNNAGDKITVRAEGRGNPRINLRDGHDLLTVYSEETALNRKSEQDVAEPLALVSADFDEDGLPDLIVGHVGPGGGTLTLHRGNADSIYPNSPEAKQRKAKGEFVDSPFLPQARVFDAPELPELLGAGDFDADGHIDLVVAARGGNVLYILPGDGHGNFDSAKRIDLPGRLTAMVTGEMNRADGLTDIVVGIVGQAGPQVLVFEGPEGALRSEPEAFALPAEASQLALDQLYDNGALMDLVVAAGSDLVIVRGRDRKLSSERATRPDVPPARVDSRSLQFTITSLAVGNFTQGSHRQIALLSDSGTVYLLEPMERTAQKDNSTDSKRRQDHTASNDTGGRQLAEEQPRPFIPTQIDQFTSESLQMSSRERQPNAPNEQNSLGSATRKRTRIRDWQLHELVGNQLSTMSGKQETSNSMFCARMSGQSGDDMVLLDAINHQLHIIDCKTQISGINYAVAESLSSENRVTLDVVSEPIAAPPMRLNAHARNGLVVLRKGQSAPSVVMPASAMTFTVTNTNDSGAGSLRQAIFDANTNLGADTIAFNIPGAGTHTIRPASQLPVITAIKLTAWSHVISLR